MIYTACGLTRWSRVPASQATAEAKDREAKTAEAEALKALDADTVKMDHQSSHARRPGDRIGRTGVDDDRMHHASSSAAMIQAAGSTRCPAALLCLHARRVVLEQLSARS